MSGTLSAKQAVALALLERARDLNRGVADPSHGLLTNEATFWDAEIKVAYIHWRTADALADRGVIRYGDSDPEWGTELWLT